MPECSYCDASFDDEESLLNHMADTHEGELGKIDRRRVADLDDDGGGLPTGPLVLVGVIGLALALVVYVVVFMGGSGGVNASGEPDAHGSAHEHGTMDVVILGEEVDFSQPRYQLQADRFHFERMNGEPNGEIWHAHASGITVEWALETLDIGVTEDSVTYQGTTYNDTDPEYNVSVEVNGEPRDPSTYALNGAESTQPGEGDHVQVEVTRANESG